MTFDIIRLLTAMDANNTPNATGARAMLALIHAHTGWNPCAIWQGDELLDNLIAIARLLAMLQTKAIVKGEVVDSFFSNVAELLFGETWENVVYQQGLNPERFRAALAESYLPAIDPPQYPATIQEALHMESDGLTSSELAAMLGVSVQTIRKRIKPLLEDDTIERYRRKRDNIPGLTWVYMLND